MRVMTMKLGDFSISKFNESMQKDVSKQKLNFCKALFISHKKISLTLEHNPEHFSNKHAVLNKDLTFSSKDSIPSFYYGASPKIDSYAIIDAISGLDFTSEKDLDEYISQHCGEFMLHEDQGEYLLDVAKLILLTMASKYGIELKKCNELAFLSENSDFYKATISYNKEKDTILMHGCPCSELIEAFSPYRFVKINDVWQISDNGISLSEIYANKSNIKLLVGKVFYSGVLLKPLEIIKAENVYENNEILNYHLIYERSTFATVCAFDDNYIDHPLLESSRTKLKDFFSYDDNCKLKLFEQLSVEGVDEEEILVHINEYIKCSYNVNQIGISSNLKTSKNEILLGLRDAKNIDEGAVYPSVNGNAEVYDEDVRFYHFSVYEDLPTVDKKQKRSDLLGEIAREAYGELNIDTTQESWSCHGMIISGNLPSMQDGSAPRRCHFNVLFENDINESLDDIKQRFLKASERFENKNFAAIIIKYYKTRFRGTMGILFDFLQKFIQNKDFVESILLLLISVISLKKGIIENSLDFSSDNILTLFSFIFAIIIVITTIVQVVQYIIKTIKNLKITKTIHIYGSMSYTSMCKRLSKAMNMKYHPATYACMKMHIENLIYNDLKENKK